MWHFIRMTENTEGTFTGTENVLETMFVITL